MRRVEIIQKIQQQDTFDIVVIGGGASGLGVALDACLRGLKVLLVDANDFGSQTSQTSTKLVHGGVRYLEKAVKQLEYGQFKLVREALRERAFMLANAPELTRTLGIYIPVKNTWEWFYYAVGVKMYGALAGKRGLRLATQVNSIFEAMPQLTTQQFTGGVRYLDGQFDDARYALALALSAKQAGAILLNYAKVTDFSYTQAAQAINGLTFIDQLTGQSHFVRCKCVVNCTGTAADTIRKLVRPNVHPRLRPSQGIHLVIKENLCPQGIGMLIPETEDGRLIFVLPYWGATLVGTTETPVPDPNAPPIPTQQEIQFLIKHLQLYFPNVSFEIKSVFAGYRPLVAAEKANTEALIRNHEVEVWQNEKIIHLLGGKWTTYRQMAEETVDAVFDLLKISFVACRTQQYRLSIPESFAPQNLASSISSAVDTTYAQTLADIMRRRWGIELFDLAQAQARAPEVAKIMANALGWKDDYTQAQIQSYTDYTDGLLALCR